MEFSVDYNPQDLTRIANFEATLLDAAQKAVDRGPWGNPSRRTLPRY